MILPEIFSGKSRKAPNEWSLNRKFGQERTQEDSKSRTNRAFILEHHAADDDGDEKEESQ